MFSLSFGCSGCFSCTLVGANSRMTDVDIYCVKESGQQMKLWRFPVLILNEIKGARLMFSACLSKKLAAFSYL